MISWSFSSRGQSQNTPLIRSTVRRVFIEPSTATPQTSPSPMV